MPSFVGRPLAEASTAVIKAGFTLGKIHYVSGGGAGSSSGTAGTVVRQSPQAGQRVAAGATISFDGRK
jgi:beta-lactam-binding protein with PASTA domain